MCVSSPPPPPQSGTNINEAMLKAVQLLDSERAELHPRSVSLMILLTDGDPTEGEGSS